MNRIHSFKYAALVLFLLTATNSFAQNKSLECISAIDKSLALIRFILKDIKNNYPWVGGGGVTEIKESATYQFDVKIPQEEKVDVIHYELSIDKKCDVKIINKTESTISYSAQ